jgi:opacity protein-like surface antigen
MKKLLVFAVLFAVLSFPTSLLARDVGPYIGIGGSYAYENFDIDDDYLAERGLSLDFDNTWGMNLKVGYHINRLFSLEFNLDFLPGFDWDGSTTYLGVPIAMDAEADITTYMIAGKISPDLGSEIIRPFVVGGFGIMHGDLDVRANAAGYYVADSDSETDMCGKIGLGVDFFVQQNVSIGLEGAYVWGLGDMDEVRYVNYTLGVAYHF